MALDLNKKVFIIYITTITSKINIHPARKAKIVLLKAKKALITIPAKYLNFAKIFLGKPAKVLPKHTKINTYAINLKKG